MISTDDGKIIDENVLPNATSIAENNHSQTTIDEIDYSSIMLDPIFNAEIENTFFMKSFLKIAENRNVDLCLYFL